MSSTAHFRGRLTRGLVLLVVLGSLMLTNSASADGATCMYSVLTKTVAVAVTPSEDFAPSLLVDDSNSIVVSDADAGTINCGLATTSNTDSVTIVNTSTSEPVDTFDVKLFRPFAPGFTDEAGSSDEIEFTVDFGPAGGTVGFDATLTTSTVSLKPVNIAAGANLVNLDASETDGVDADVTIVSASSLLVSVTELPDTVDLSGGGPGVPDQPLPIDANIFPFFDASPDVFIGGDGDDRIRGGGGDDLLEGRAGNDVISGGTGEDEILGGSGVDEVAGEGAGIGQPSGQDGDSISGGGGDDFLFGDAGGDVLQGQAGVDEVFGGPGADQLFGGLGPDTLAGSAGNDTLNGGPANDVCNGGPGADTFAPSCEGQNQ
jgi:Ca2+-binding RTX toxin-like protein